MSDFFASVAKAWDDLTASLHETYDASRRAHNRASTEDRRAKSARATGWFASATRDSPRSRRTRTSAVIACAFWTRARTHRTFGGDHRRSHGGDDGASRLANRNAAEEFTSMTNLRVVDLRGNALRALPDDIGCLVRLETLDVGENALETLPKSLGIVVGRRLGVSANVKLRACLDALGNCIDLESVDASKNRSMCGALPVSWGCLIKLKEINVGEASSVQSRFFFVAALQTLSARRCAALDVAAMKETEGYEHYEARRKGKHDKQLSSRVLMERRDWTNVFDDQTKWSWYVTMHLVYR